MKSFQINGAGGPVEMSKIVMGTTYIGTDIPDEVSFRLLDEYYALGGRTIDTARMYGQSEDFGISKSEFFIGKWIQQRGLRKDITLITKGCHFSWKTGENRITPEDITRDFHDSLQCLSVDEVDLYFLHRDDKTKPVGSIMDALHELVKSGKTRAIGASNWSLDRILLANDYARENGKTPFSVSQLQWSAAKCTAESWGDDRLEYMDGNLRERYLKEKIPVMAFAAQAKGLFSKYIANPDAQIPPKAKRFYSPENMKKIEIVKRICDETGYSPAAVIIAYITSHPIQAAAIIGCSNLLQLRDTLTGADFELTPDIIKELEEV